MRKTYLAWIAIFVAVAGGFWAFLDPGTSRSQNAQKPAAGTVVPVTAARASRQNLPIYYQELANVQAFNAVTIKPQVDGQLRQIAFKEGQEVRAGELLAQIDPRTYQAALDQALAKKTQDQAQLANARTDLVRYTGLAEKNYVSHQQLDTTQALVNQLQAAVQGDDAAIENARVMLGYTAITSPIDGRTGIRQIDAGNIVHASDATGIVVVTQVRPISVLFSLPEDNLTRVLQAMNGQSLKVAALSRDGTRLLDEGKLEVIDSQIDQTTGMVRLKATMPNQKGTLWPGQFVNARLQVDTLSQALTIPARAVQRGPQGAYAFVVKADSTVEVRPLELGETSNGMVVVKSGVTEGEQVVIEGQYRLDQGTRVEAKIAEAAANPSAKTE